MPNHILSSTNLQKNPKIKKAYQLNLFWQQQKGGGRAEKTEGCRHDGLPDRRRTLRSRLGKAGADLHGFSLDAIKKRPFGRK